MRISECSRSVCVCFHSGLLLQLLQQLLTPDDRLAFHLEASANSNFSLAPVLSCSRRARYRQATLLVVDVERSKLETHFIGLSPRVSIVLSHSFTFRARVRPLPPTRASSLFPSFEMFYSFFHSKRAFLTFILSLICVFVVFHSLQVLSCSHSGLTCGIN